MGRRDFVAQSSQEVNSSASPALAEQPWKSWNKVPPTLIPLFHGQVDCNAQKSKLKSKAPDPQHKSEKENTFNSCFPVFCPCKW